MNMNEIIKKFGLITVVIVLLYTSYNGILSFWQGYHNLDSSFNYIHLGLNQDINTDGVVRSLRDTYLLGLNQMKNGFSWLCFDVILGVLTGFLIKK